MGKMYSVTSILRPCDARLHRPPNKATVCTESENNEGVNVHALRVYSVYDLPIFSMKSSSTFPYE